MENIEIWQIKDYLERTKQALQLQSGLVAIYDIEQVIRYINELEAKVNEKSKTLIYD